VSEEGLRELLAGAVAGRRPSARGGG
jgi:hypothetical protein